jgi:hypothetical protein
VRDGETIRNAHPPSLQAQVYLKIALSAPAGAISAFLPAALGGTYRGTVLRPARGRGLSSTHHICSMCLEPSFRSNHTRPAPGTTCKISIKLLFLHSSALDAGMRSG